jgi:hypothetical protein
LARLSWETCPSHARLAVKVLRNSQSQLQFFPRLQATKIAEQLGRAVLPSIPKVGIAMQRIG